MNIKIRFKNILPPEAFKVFENESIKEVMRHIDKNSFRFAVIVNNENKLKGVVSDGDIRRSILKGIDISQSISLIMNKNPLVIEILEDNEN
ncbi:MAG: CBS domain-containing protein, partial [Promethearchaeia archaeon]